MKKCVMCRIKYENKVLICVSLSCAETKTVICNLEKTTFTKTFILLALQVKKRKMSKFNFQKFCVI